MVIPFRAFPQMEDDDELFRPKYAPRSEKHRNKMDALGRKQGLWRYYTREGVLFMEITYQNDIKHGPSIRHHTASGVIIEECTYFNGRRDGEYKRYSANGILTTEGNYSMGRKTGIWVTYYMVNGEKKSEGSYANGKKNGEWKYYTSKGRIKLYGNYKDGLREGEWIFYNPDGSVAESKKYVNGVSPEEGKQLTSPDKKKSPFKDKYKDLKEKNKKQGQGESNTGHQGSGSPQGQQP